MDLPSLPEELLTSVLKYSDFETISKLRKMNKQVDVIVKRNKLNKLKVSWLSLAQTFCSTDEIQLAFGTDEFRTKFIKKVDADEKTVVRFVKKCLKKFRSVDCLTLADMKVHSSLLQLLLKYKSLFRGKMNVMSCTIHAPVHELAELIEGCRESEVEENTWPILGGVKYGANDEIACALIPVVHDLSFWSNTFSEAAFPGVTDKTLKMLGKHPKNFFSLFYCDIGATGKRVVRLAKKAFANGHEFEYTLGRVKVNDQEEAKHWANQLKSIQGVTAHISTEYMNTSCHLSRGNSQFDVEFICDPPVIDEPMEEEPWVYFDENNDKAAREEAKRKRRRF